MIINSPGYSATLFFFRKIVKSILLFLLLLFFIGNVFSQTGKKDSLNKSSDTAKVDLYSLLQNAGKELGKKSFKKYEENRITNQQNKVLQEIKKVSQKTKAYLKRGVDTVGIKQDLYNIQSWIDIAGEGIFKNKADLQTHRNLTTSTKLFNEILKKALVQKERIDRHESELNNFKFKLDSLATDSSLYKFSSDTGILNSYLSKLAVASLEVDEPDSLLEHALKNIHQIQSYADIQVNVILANIEEIKGLEKMLAHNVENTEFNRSDMRVFFDSSLNDVFSTSFKKGKLTLLFYLQNNMVKLFLLLVLIILLTTFLRGLKNRLKQDQALQTGEFGQLVFRNVFLTSVIIVLNLFQFIFIEPPFIFSVILWSLSFLSLVITFWNYITTFWMWIWITMLLLFLLASFDNLILYATSPEITGILLLAVAGVIFAAVVLFNRHKKELKEKGVLFFFGLLFLMELASVIANIYGRYNLSKNLMTTGYSNAIIGFLFLWTIRCINDGLAIASLVYAHPDGIKSILNFEKIGKKVPAIFNLMLILGWLILFGRNFYSFTLITQPVKDFLFDERMVGDYSFSISNVLIFFMIMVIAVILSKIVSFFATDQYRASGSSGKKGGVGSWLLLIRITIICMGLFMAFAASGIPMDRIAIILGALGVGIGLGLQALVNNLVSGLIIAFEKPVNVGDVVEIGGQSGTMKSIGFRSSVISTWDGADMIIPNGDLLNAHLINWTLSGSMRRAEILVSVTNKNDIEKTKIILNEVLLKEERVLKSPPPSVILKEFHNSSIDIRVLFWVSNYGDWTIVKSDLLSAIDIAFKENEIEIPLPK